MASKKKQRRAEQRQHKSSVSPATDTEYMEGSARPPLAGMDRLLTLVGLVS